MCTFVHHRKTFVRSFITWSLCSGGAYGSKSEKEGGGGEAADGRSPQGEGQGEGEPPTSRSRYI